MWHLAMAHLRYLMLLLAGWTAGKVRPTPYAGAITLPREGAHGRHLVVPTQAVLCVLEIEVQRSRGPGLYLGEMRTPLFFRDLDVSGRYPLLWGLF